MTPRFLTLAALAAVTLSGCGGDSSLNPFSWFRSEPSTDTVEEATVPVITDTRPLVDQVTALSIDRTPGGAIIRATALPPVQGWYDAGLVPVGADAETGTGILAFTFRARPPAGPTRTSTPASRELTAAVFVSDIALDGVREIRVSGASSARTARR